MPIGSIMKKKDVDFFKGQLNNLLEELLSQADRMMYHEKQSAVTSV